MLLSPYLILVNSAKICELCWVYKRGLQELSIDIAPYFKELEVWKVWKNKHTPSMAETINYERYGWGPWDVGNLRKIGENFVEEKTFKLGLEG